MRSIIEIFFIFLGLSFLTFIILLGLHNIALINLDDLEFVVISVSIGFLMSVYHFRNTIVDEGE
ncbi:MAG: hypothetical protein J7J96_01805 [Sulfurimonas sp.]|nr:hypothetical protein [Sulfurimonas sp.]